MVSPHSSDLYVPPLSWLLSLILRRSCLAGYFTPKIVFLQFPTAFSSLATPKMNRPSRTDGPHVGDGYSQNPPQLSNDLTTNQDLGGISNTRVLQREAPPAMLDPDEAEPDPPDAGVSDGPSKNVGSAAVGVIKSASSSGAELLHTADSEPDSSGRNEHPPHPGEHGGLPPQSWLARAKHAILTFGKFIGPGFMVAVAYSMPTV
jgi:metal iron transporter